MANFFYSINVNDRVKFPVFGERKPHATNETPGTVQDDTLTIEEEERKLRQAEDNYFEVLKKTNCEKGLYCDEMLHFLEGFFKRMRRWRTMQGFLASFSTYVHNHSNEFRELTDTMNAKQLITPYIELDLPANIIQEFNQLDQDDPRILLYQLNPVWAPAIKQFGFFWERYESNNEVLCLFVWSNVDQTVVPLPAVGLNPYPLCWVCDKGFGTLACTRCRVAKYCSKECQEKDWIRHGGPVCDDMASSLRRVKQLSFKCPALPSKHSVPSSTSSRSTSSKPHTSKHSKAAPPSRPLPYHNLALNPATSSNSSSASSSSSRSAFSSPSASPSPSPPSSPYSSLSEEEVEYSEPPLSLMEDI